MVKLVFIFLIVLNSVLYAKDGSLIDEYERKAKIQFGDKRYRVEHGQLKANSFWHLAKRKEKEFLESKKGKKLSFYEEIIPLLCKANSETSSSLPSYIAVEISEHLWLMKNQKINSKCIKKMTEVLVKKRVCTGYLYNAFFKWEDGKKEAAISLLNEGVVNCKLTYELERIRKELLLYKYKNKKR